MTIKIIEKVALNGWYQFFFCNFANRKNNYLWHKTLKDGAQDWA